AAVAFVPEFLWRMVAELTVWTDSFELLTIPACLRAGVCNRFELVTIHELVAEPTVQRFDEAVLPGMAWRHRDRLRSHRRQPPRQCRADELRTVVAADPRRRPTATDNPGQHLPHVGAGHRVGHVQYQALPSIFVHQRQPLER